MNLHQQQNNREKYSVIVWYPLNIQIMKNIITSVLFTLFLSIGLGIKSEAQKIFDGASEHIQFQNKLSEDALVINTASSVDIKFSQNYRITGITKSNKKEFENLQTASIDRSNNNNTKPVEQPVILHNPPTQDMAKEVSVISYKVDYKGGTKYFPSSVEGEAFMRKLNNDYQKNMIPNPGNVNGYYTISLVQGLIDYGRWNAKAQQIY